MKRRGHTLIELLVSLTVGSIVLALAATVGFRHQRFHRDIALIVERTEQIEQIASLLPISLRSIASGEGDIAPGGARDTSLEFRAVIATGVACDSSAATILMAPVGVPPRLSSLLTRPQRGDTLWAVEIRDTTEHWTPIPITEVRDSLAICRIGGAHPYGVSPRPSLALRVASVPASLPSAMRITRPFRYSLYRASDGAWYLGAKEWNPTLARFNTIQPVAGPLRSASALGLRLSYADSLGHPIPSGTVDTRRIATIAVAFQGDSVIPGAYAHPATVRGASAVIGLRNPP